jgi:hypothetical protein
MIDLQLLAVAESPSGSTSASSALAKFVFGTSFYHTASQAQTIEPSAKPPVLRLAGGAKLRPAEVGFGVTHYKLTNCNGIAEDSERPGADVRWGFAITSIDCEIGFSCPVLTKNKTITVDAEALFCVGNAFTGTSINVYRADEFNENDPTYIVKGIHNDKDYEIFINIFDSNPCSASEIEITALLTHLRENGIIDEVARPVRFWDENDNFASSYPPFEKANYVQLFNDCYRQNLKNRNPYIEHILNLEKIVSALK